ncbi:RNA-binding ATPase activator esf2 [Agyrium rufum]|nr:RNA-binding ATPase activator esf2 [Agyrium rufum]
MAGLKRNRYLDTGLSDEDVVSISASEDGTERSKMSRLGSSSVKRRKVTSGEEDEEESEDDDFVSMDSEQQQPDHISKHPNEEKTKPMEEVDDGEGSPPDADQFYTPKSTASAKRSENLEKPPKAKKPSRHKAGVIYLSRIPPFMKPHAVKHLLTPYGTISRLFLTPESPAQYLSRKKAHGNKKRSYLDGWVEFERKKHAKHCAEAINGAIVGGKKGGYYHDDIWNAKYLRGFSWEDLMESVRVEEREREERMRVEIRREGKERKAFLESVDVSKKERGMERKRKEKSKVGDSKANQPDPVDTRADGADAGSIQKEIETASKRPRELHFRQIEVKKPVRHTGGQPDEVERVLSKIF